MEQRIIAISVDLDPNTDRWQKRVLRIIGNKPVNFMAHSEDKYRKQLPEDAKYPSNLRHRLLIIYTLISVAVREYLETGTKPKWESRSDIRVSLDAISVFADEVSKSNPRGALQVILDMVADARTIARYLME